MRRCVAIMRGTDLVMRVSGSRAAYTASRVCTDTAKELAARDKRGIARNAPVLVFVVRDIPKKTMTRAYPPPRDCTWRCSFECRERVIHDSRLTSLEGRFSPFASTPLHRCLFSRRNRPTAIYGNISIIDKPVCDDND